MKHFKTLVLLANFLFVLIAGFALGIFSTNFLNKASANNASDNYIYACVKNSNGSITIVNSTSCGSGETSLVWNKKDIPGIGGFVNDLRGAKFKWTDLSFRNFHGQDLTDAIFTSSGTNTAYRIDLSNANLTNATLSMNFGEANLSNVNFTGSHLGSGAFGSADFSNDDLRQPADLPKGLPNTNLTSTNFSGLNLSGLSDISSANLTNSDMSSTSATLSIAFSNSNLTQTNFSNTSLPDSQFDGTTADHTNFTGATLTSTNFSNATLTNTNFTNANLTSANFSGATFTSVIWSNTTCPDGTNSNSDGNTCENNL